MKTLNLELVGVGNWMPEQPPISFAEMGNAILNTIRKTWRTLLENYQRSQVQAAESRRQIAQFKHEHLLNKLSSTRAYL